MSGQGQGEESESQGIIPPESILAVEELHCLWQELESKLPPDFIAQATIKPSHGEDVVTSTSSGNAEAVIRVVESVPSSGGVFEGRVSLPVLKQHIRLCLTALAHDGSNHGKLAHPAQLWRDVEEMQSLTQTISYCLSSNLICKDIDLLKSVLTFIKQLCQPSPDDVEHHEIVLLAFDEAGIVKPILKLYQYFDPLPDNQHADVVLALLHCMVALTTRFSKPKESFFQFEVYDCVAKTTRRILKMKIKGLSVASEVDQMKTVSREQSLLQAKEYLETNATHLAIIQVMIVAIQLIGNLACTLDNPLLNNKDVLLQQQIPALLFNVMVKYILLHDVVEKTSVAIGNLCNGHHFNRLELHSFDIATLMMQAIYLHQVDAKTSTTLQAVVVCIGNLCVEEVLRNRFVELHLTEVLIEIMGDKIGDMLLIQACCVTLGNVTCEQVVSKQICLTLQVTQLLEKIYAKYEGKSLSIVKSINIISQHLLEVVT